MRIGSTQLKCADGSAAIGSTGKRSVELHCSPNLSSADESFIRSHIKAKQE